MMVIQYESFIGAGEIYIKGSAWNPPSTHLWGVCKVYEDYRRCTRSCTGSWSENGDGVCAKICVTLIDEVIIGSSYDCNQPFWSCSSWIGAELSWVGIFMFEILILLLISWGHCLSWVGIFILEISPCGYGSTSVVTSPLSGDLQVEILIQILIDLLYLWPTEIQSNCYTWWMTNSDYEVYSTNYKDFLFESRRTLTYYVFLF